MKLNIIKNSNEKEKVYNINNSNKERIPINIPFIDCNKIGQEKVMNINFNNINM
jgi:hypothetical protein